MLQRLFDIDNLLLQDILSQKPLNSNEKPVKVLCHRYDNALNVKLSFATSVF